MPKPRGKINRSDKVRSAQMKVYEPELEIAAWCPDHFGLKPPEQVHFILRVAGFKSPFILRWKSPDTLGFIIEELIKYRREVWPDSEQIKGENDAHK